MSWVPAFRIGLLNGWIFMMIYPLQWGIVLVAPKDITERTGHPPELNRGRKRKLLAGATQAFWIGATLYSAFLPLHIGSALFYAGLVVFIAGVSALVFATVSVFRTGAGSPFTRGIYRYSRHPMYLSMILVYTGVSVSTVSWLFFLITVITIFLQRFQMIQEEQYCFQKYASVYVSYMAVTPRWIGIPRCRGGDTDEECD